MTWQNEYAEEFERRQKAEIECSIKDCNKNSTITVQEYPEDSKNQPFKFYCNDHKEKR